jgi:hypothetical protein
VTLIRPLPGQPEQAGRKPRRERRAAAVGAARRGQPATGEGTALALLRANPTAVLRAGPRFPSSARGSGGRSGAGGRPPNPGAALAAGAAVGRAAAAAGGARSSFQATAVPAGAPRLPGHWRAGGSRAAAPVRLRHGTGARAAARAPGAGGRGYGGGGSGSPPPGDPPRSAGRLSLPLSPPTPSPLHFSPSASRLVLPFSTSTPMG